jgi:hypothetical protein
MGTGVYRFKGEMQQIVAPAKISLPTPFSPSNSTVAAVGPAFCTMWI